MQEPKRFGGVAGRHLYSLGVEGPDKVIEVSAHNRTQAAAIARREGYVVRDVNMIG